MTSYQYAPLPTSQHIRLLTLRAEDLSGPLEGVISVVSIQECPPYQALSYVWGSNDKTRLLNTPGGHIRISESLFSALARIRRVDTDFLGTAVESLRSPPRSSQKPLVLWVDAVCMYSYRTAMKHLVNLRLMPQFSEGFNFVSERKNSCSVLSTELIFRLITIFVQERERGCCSNWARDGTLGKHEGARQSTGRTTRSAA